MNDLITIDDMSVTLSLSRAYVRDRLVKRIGFPRPKLDLSQKCRRWCRDEFNAWLKKEAKVQAR